MTCHWLNLPFPAKLNDIAIDLNKSFDLAFWVTFFVLKYTDGFLSHDDFYNYKSTIKRMMKSMIGMIVNIIFKSHALITTICKR